MAAPQRRAPYYPPPEKTRPRSYPVYRKRSESLKRRRFLFLVVVPVLLMLGSIYLHTVSAGLEGRALELQERRAELAADKEKLNVRASEASAPGRVRSLARENGLRSPAAKNLEVYEVEDGTQDARQQIQEGSR